MARISLILLLIGAFVSLVSAASAPTFCKCTCGKNSTIIPLGPAHQNGKQPTLHKRLDIFNPASHHLPDSPASDHDDDADLHAQSKREMSPLAQRSKSTSCSECTKAFCLSQGISFCKGVDEDIVTTMCFQRDSNKDKIVVWGFIAGTAGLLGWAAFKKVLEWREGNPLARPSTNYVPVQGNNFR